MRPQKIDDTDLIEKIVPLLKNRGYAGTSLQDLSEVTGLKKASLYHRFPGGKEDMVMSALKHVSIQIRSEILDVLIDKSLKTDMRLEKAIRGILRYYEKGKSPCLFRSLSLETGQNTFANELNVSMVRWLEAFTEFGMDSGFDVKTAKNKAMKCLVTIQGSLVVCQTLKSTEPFLDAMDYLRELFQKP